MDSLSQQYPQLVNKTSGGYSGGTRENYRLTLAKQIDAQAAIESASWGLFQIMGFHWQMLGYQSAGQFEQQMSENEDNQLYNGPAYKKNNYDEKLKAAYDTYSNATKK